MMTPVSFAFVVRLQMLARVLKSLGLDFLVIFLLIMKYCRILN